MTIATELIKERDSYAGTPVFPTSNNGTQSTGTVDMSKAYRVEFMIGVGTLGSSGTVDAWIQQGNNANGSDATNIASGAITQITAANNNATVEISAAELTGRYVRGQVKVAVGASIVCMYPRATGYRYKAQASDDGSFGQRLVV